LRLLEVGQSGQPGSPFYRNQFPEWIRGDYHVLSLDRATVEKERTASVRFEP